jgi:hypothetical protein
MDAAEWTRAAARRMAEECALECDLGNWRDAGLRELLGRIQGACERFADQKQPAPARVRAGLMPFLHDSGWTAGGEGSPAVRDALVRLYRDLEYMEAFAGGGLPLVNALVGRQLDELKAESNWNRAEQIAMRLEDWLYRAI